MNTTTQIRTAPSDARLAVAQPRVRYWHDGKASDNFSGIKIIADTRGNDSIPDDDREGFLRRLLATDRMHDAVVFLIATSPIMHFWSFDIPFLPDADAWPVLRRLMIDERLGLVEGTDHTYALVPNTEANEDVLGVREIQGCAAERQRRWCRGPFCMKVVSFVLATGT